MFKAKAARPAAFVLIVAGAAVFVSCQDGTTAPTPEAEMPSFDVVGIWGYVTEASSGDPIKDAYVEWWCETCDARIGEDVADDIGLYHINPAPPFNWSEHDDHDLAGEATHPLYEPCPGNIPNFQSSSMPYQLDFEMVPGK